MKEDSDAEGAGKAQGYAVPAGAIVPQQSMEPDGALSLNRWGFEDTYFESEAEWVRLAGERYAHSGQTFDQFFAWADSRVGVDMRGDIPRDFRYNADAVPESRLTDQQKAALDEILGSEGLCLDKAQRLRRGHGHALQDVFDVNFGRTFRVPDAVAQPESEAGIEKLVTSAAKWDLCLIPYGGGTNVTQATRCPEDEARAIVVVDLSRMNRVRWIDANNGVACIEAGATGGCIERVLAVHGFTLGHEPDSRSCRPWVAG